VDRTGLFNGLIPVTSLAAVALTGTGTITITPVGLLGALSVLAGQRPQPSAETAPISPHTGPAPAQSAMTDTTPQKAAA